MEKFHQLLLESDRLFKTADHLAYVTYPMLKEVKLTITISNNLYAAMTKAMEAVLEYEKYYKKIFSYPEDFNSRLQVFMKSMQRYGISQNFIDIIKDLNKIVNFHRSSPIEIVRDNRYVIFTEAYRDSKTVDIETLKRYIFNIRPSLEKIYKLGM